MTVSRNVFCIQKENMIVEVCPQLCVKGRLIRGVWVCVIVKAEVYMSYQQVYIFKWYFRWPYI